MVSAAHRNTDRDFDRLHGAREHRAGGHEPPLDDCVRIRSGSRLRLLVRAEGEAAVRRVAPADVPALVQYRRRAWAAPGALAAHSVARRPFPVCGRRTDGNDHLVGAGGSYGLALDDRTSRSFASVQISVAVARRLPADHCDALADVDL